jgi:hypothetical protein
LALVYVRLRGRWTPGPVSMGRWSGPVTYVAAAWIVFESINIAWPRPINGVWYLNWGIIIMSGIVGALGVLIARFFLTGTHGKAGTADSIAEPVDAL